MTQTYNAAVLQLAQAGIQALADSNTQHKGIQTPAQESHFLCSWMVDSLKTKRFSKLVADDLTQWIRLGRSKGAGAELKRLLERIVFHYQTAKTEQLADAVQNLLAEFEALDWLVISDTPLTEKLKLEGDGRSSIVVCASQLAQHIQQGELIKPISLYVRGDEQQLATLALKHGLLLSQANKKNSLIKHHKTYVVSPKNNHVSLCLLAQTI
ncbi:DUF2913 family protein [Shewanella gaetbuli]